MQNPLQGVAQQLHPHVHLISSHRYPTIPSPSLEQAFTYLGEAPSIVKQIASMSWRYVAAPQDGTVWLEWLPPDKSDQPFPSDGYLWGDPEQTFQQSVQGYTIEYKVHRFGYRPGFDQVASHARTRYHFLSKNPSVNAPPPDPSLWIVHYHRTDQMIPANQIPTSQQMQQIMVQRRWMESQGGLESREFMLHDREHWPTITGPGQQAAQYNPMAPAQGRYPQPYPQQIPQPPVAKKPRLSGPIPGSSDGPHEMNLELEEDTALGDFFDHLTQRDISLARYTQHHRWMEEVFSSPYASNQIVPADLGMGLMGELKGLTDGILQPPDLDVHDLSNQPAKPEEAEQFTNLKKEQVEEFNKRVAKHLEEGQAEIERMKSEHAAKMQDWKKVKSLMQAEKRLRYATWDGHEAALSTYRLEEPATNGEDGRKETVEEVVKDVESLLNVKIEPHEAATLIQRGGLKDRKQPTFEHEQQHDQQDIAIMNNQQQQPPSGHEAVESTTYHEDPTAATKNADEISQAAQRTVGSSQNQQMANADSQQAMGTHTPGDSLENMPGIDMDDTLMEGMELNDTNLDFGNDTAGGLGDDSGPQPGAQTSNSSRTAVGSSNTAHADHNMMQPQPELTGADDMDGAGDASMFNDNTFDDLANIDGNGDGLIDFDGGSMGIDDAFGDALHGMDDGPEGDGNPATGA